MTDALAFDNIRAYFQESGKTAYLAGYSRDSHDLNPALLLSLTSKLAGIPQHQTSLPSRQLSVLMRRRRSHERRL